MTVPVSTEGARVIPIDSEQEWAQLCARMGAHPLQLWGWGKLKAAFGWRAIRVAVHSGDDLDAVAQILVRPVPWPFRALCYIPRGPALAPGASWDRVLSALSQWCRTHVHAVLLEVEPGVETWDAPSGFRRARGHILYPHTAVIDLTRDPDEIFHDFHSKTRQYIRKSEREGVTVELVTSADTPEFTAVLDIYHDTAQRAGFLIHADAYYRTALKVLGDAGRLYVAKLNGEVVSFLWLVVSEATSFELWGGMSSAGEHARANYTLKAKAILACHEAGVAAYDMNGLLGEGISRFKRSFVQHDTEWVGTFERPLSALYPLWVRVFPLARRIVKALGR
ncbi:MAG TPA: peptidoglycan bridge formation glycyltransferase FemA/FemB family protein [Pseudoclavibacter sp.]|nr:peptidoglycan bridge formation glycyltransferase FemA/FemB family protein [Pseudoclavibacter sp.]